MWLERYENPSKLIYDKKTFTKQMVEHFYEDFLYSCVLTSNQTKRFNTIGEYVKIAKNNENTDVESMLEYFIDGYEWNIDILEEIKEILLGDYFYEKGNKPNFQPLEAIEIAIKTNQEVISNIKELIKIDFKNGNKMKIDKNDYDFTITVEGFYIAVKIFGEHPFINFQGEMINRGNTPLYLKEGFERLKDHLEYAINRGEDFGVCVLYEDYDNIYRGHWFILD